MDSMDKHIFTSAAGFRSFYAARIDRPRRRWRLVEMIEIDHEIDVMTYRVAGSDAISTTVPDGWIEYESAEWDDIRDFGSPKMTPTEVKSVEQQVAAWRAQHG